MWDKESRRAAQRAYRENRRAARLQYKASRRFYRMNRRSGYFGLGGVILAIILLLNLFHRLHQVEVVFTLLIPLVIVCFLITIIVNRIRSNQFPYQQPYDPSARQPYQGTEQPYYQPPQTPPQPEPYQPYDQGYQAPASPEVEGEQEYRSPASSQESYSQDEQPQALYPQSLPPMEQ